MSGSINKVILIGHLGRDPEVRTSAAGDRVVTFSMATTESWRDKATGERKDRTEWHNVVVFNDGIGKVAEQYCRKGSKVYLEGQLQTREYTDKNGDKRKTTEIVLQRFRGELTLLDSQKREAPSPDDYGQTSTRDSSNNAGARNDWRSSQQNQGSAPAGRISDTLDDDIPFAPEFR